MLVNTINQADMLVLSAVFFICFLYGLIKQEHPTEKIVFAALSGVVGVSMTVLVACVFSGIKYLVTGAPPAF